MISAAQSLQEASLHQAVIPLLPLYPSSCLPPSWIQLIPVSSLVEPSSSLHVFQTSYAKEWVDNAQSFYAENWLLSIYPSLIHRACPPIPFTYLTLHLVLILLSLSSAS